MKIADIPDDGLRHGATQFIQNLDILKNKLSGDWSRRNIAGASDWFGIVAGQFMVMAQSPDPFPGEEKL